MVSRSALSNVVIAALIACVGSACSSSSDTGGPGPQLPPSDASGGDAVSEATTADAHADSDTPPDAADDPAQPDSPLPDAAQPDAAEPDAAEPDAAEPDAAQPDAAEPDAAEPDAAQPDAAQPDATEPDAAQPDAAQLDAPEPDVAEQDASQVDAPSCTSPMAECDGDFATVCETNLNTDSDHCGACGRSCQGAACSDGQCAPLPLADAQSFGYNTPKGIAVDATSVYFTVWTSNGRVMKVGKDGTGLQDLATAQNAPFDIAVDSGAVYWTNANSGQVMTVAKSGGTPTELAGGQPSPYGIAVDDTYVYWVDNGNGSSTSGKVMRRAKDGSGSVTELVSARPFPYSIAIDDTHMYWTEYATSGSVYRARKDGTDVQPVATAQKWPYIVALYEDKVYWTNQSSNGGAVMVASKAGGNASILASDNSNPRGITVDGSGVYWTSFSSDLIKFIPLAGGTPLVLAEGGIGYSPYVKSPDRITGDSTTLYWTNTGYYVSKMAK